MRDGDTIEVGKRPIHLNGISALELDEPLGSASKQFMVNLVDGKIVRCELTGARTYARLVGIFYLDGRDVGEAVITPGSTLACPRYSGGCYTVFEVFDALEAIVLPGYCR